MSILLRHPVSGQVKRFPEGWSWACFFGVGLLGGPLFRRGLPLWGAIMVSVNVLALASGVASASGLNSFLAVAALALNAFLGLKANEMAINRYRNLGWEPADRAAARW